MSGWDVIPDDVKDTFATALDVTRGEIYEEGLDIAWGGACPVQGFGIVDGHGCYYRSRGEGWSFEVYRGPLIEGEFGLELPPHEEILWSYTRTPYTFMAGGWVDAATSERCIREAVAGYRALDKGFK